MAAVSIKRSIQLVFCKKKKTIWFIGVEVEQETSAPPPNKNPGSAPDLVHRCYIHTEVYSKPTDSDSSASLEERRNVTVIRKKGN